MPLPASVTVIPLRINYDIMNAEGLWAGTLRKLSAERLHAHAAGHSLCHEDLDWEAEFDRSMWLLCPTLTPLYYTPSYRRLTAEQQLRYNQLAGLGSNELIGTFERSLQPIFRSLINDRRLPEEIRSLLPGFLADERRHSDMWWRLNRLTQNDWYRGGPEKVVHLRWSARAFIKALASQPTRFPVVVWVALALEEHSLEITRRCLRCPLPIEPRHLAAYKLHAKDEVRHVQIDWHVLDILLGRLSREMLLLNLRMFRAIVHRFLLRPVHATVGVLKLLADEFPALRHGLPTMQRELGGLSESAEYRGMIFSRESNPITFDMIDRFPESRRAFDDLC